MRTHSHFLVAALIWDILRRRGFTPGRAFLAGSVIPDIPLMFLTLWYLLHRIFSSEPPSEEHPLYGLEYDDYYFHNDWWKLLTSLFHAPALIGLYILIGAALWSWYIAFGMRIIWFGLSCGLHAVIDICTHVNDGILLLFPFNWDYRFHSCVSYYDPKYGGEIFTLVEYAVDTILILYFLYRGVEASLDQKQRVKYVEVQHSDQTIV